MTGSYFKPNNHLNPFSDSNFTALFNELYSPLCHFCMKLTGDKEIAEDIVQEKFVYIWEHRLRLEKITSLKSYLFTAVKHSAINHLKKHFNKNTDYCLENLSENNLHDTLPDPSELLENKELAIVLNKALTDLPEKCRIIFTMKKMGECTNKEIARKLDISVKTVEAQMTIAFKKLMTFVTNHSSLLFLLFISRFRDFL
jgi:RNA polymerase sigma-70 factor (ECF subfamily)